MSPVQVLALIQPRWRSPQSVSRCSKVPMSWSSSSIFFMTASFVGFAISEFTVKKSAVHKFAINSSTVKILQTTSLEKGSFEKSNAVLSPQGSLLGPGLQAVACCYGNGLICQEFETVAGIPQIRCFCCSSTTAAGEIGTTWSLWQKTLGEILGWPSGFGYRGSEACYTPTEKLILAAYEGVCAALEVTGTKTQLHLGWELV